MLRKIKRCEIIVKEERVGELISWVYQGIEIGKINVMIIKLEIDKEMGRDRMDE